MGSGADIWVADQAKKALEGLRGIMRNVGSDDLCGDGPLNARSFGGLKDFLDTLRAFASISRLPLAAVSKQTNVRGLLRGSSAFLVQQGCCLPHLCSSTICLHLSSNK